MRKVKFTSIANFVDSHGLLFFYDMCVTWLKQFTRGHDQLFSGRSQLFGFLYFGF